MPEGQPTDRTCEIFRPRDKAATDKKGTDQVQPGWAGQDGVSILYIYIYIAFRVIQQQGRRGEEGRGGEGRGGGDLTVLSQQSGVRGA